jgi:hypothetical protein
MEASLDACCLERHEPCVRRGPWRTPPTDAIGAHEGNFVGQPLIAGERQPRCSYLSGRCPCTFVLRESASDMCNPRSNQLPRGESPGEGPR